MEINCKTIRRWNRIKENFFYAIGFLTGILICSIPLILVFYGLLVALGNIIPEKILNTFELQGNLIILIGGLFFLFIGLFAVKFKIEKIEKRLKNLEEK